MNKENLPVEIRKTYLRPYIERIYCKKCGAELKTDDDALGTFMNLLNNGKYAFKYHCDKCNIDYCSNDKYPKTEYEEISE